MTRNFPPSAEKATDERLNGSETVGVAMSNRASGGTGTENAIRSNRVCENGTQRLADLEGRGILATGARTHHNRIEHTGVSIDGIPAIRPYNCPP